VTDLAAILKPLAPFIGLGISLFISSLFAEREGN